MSTYVHAGQLKTLLQGLSPNEPVKITAGALSYLLGAVGSPQIPYYQPMSAKPLVDLTGIQPSASG